MTSNATHQPSRKGAANCASKFDDALVGRLHAIVRRHAPLPGVQEASRGSLPCRQKTAIAPLKCSLAASGRCRAETKHPRCRGADEVERGSAAYSAYAERETPLIVTSRSRNEVAPGRGDGSAHRVRQPDKCVSDRRRTTKWRAFCASQKCVTL